MSKKSLAIVILAAGQGTRMKSATPKVLHELAGLPMIKWLLRTAEELDPEKIVVVLAPGAAEIAEAIKPHATATQMKADGTAGAVRAAMPSLAGFKGDILILLGDTPLLQAGTLRALIDLKNSTPNTGITVLGAEMANPTGYGRLILSRNGTLKKIVEEKDAAEKEKACTLVNTGAFCVDGAKLGYWLEMIGNKNAKGEFYITDLPAAAARDGMDSYVFAMENPEEAKGCNSRLDLAALEQQVQKIMRKKFMEEGVTLIDPDSVFFRHDTRIGRDVIIEPGVFFGADVEIEEGARIRAFSHIEGAVIGKNAAIGPFARLRPGTEIGDDVRIGNFVEIKKSKIGARSKVSHLAYVGDTLMGDDTNFSAGAITVNYDGFQKHQTVIGRGVMIGSNVNLIAPLTIDDGAYIAAGSTITDDVPADALSVARGKPELRKGWAAEFRKRKEAAKKKKKGKK
jgi:bifunctional UDP-N-acetylglucosamine pyrophosphorylase/glucosamine-1-phosphate N-acetyltransferase